MVRMRRVLSDITNQTGKRGFMAIESGDGPFKDYDGGNVSGSFAEGFCVRKPGRGENGMGMAVSGNKQKKVGSHASVATSGCERRDGGKGKELAVWNDKRGKIGSQVLVAKQGLKEKLDVMEVDGSSARRFEEKYGVLDVGDGPRDSCISSDTGGKLRNEGKMISLGVGLSSINSSGLGVQVSCEDDYDVGFTTSTSSKYGPAENLKLPISQGSRSIELEKCSSIEEGRVKSNTYGNLVFGHSMVQGSGGIDLNKSPGLEEGSMNMNTWDDLFLSQPMVQGSRGTELEKCSSIEEDRANSNAYGNLVFGQSILQGSRGIYLNKRPRHKERSMNMNTGDDLFLSQPMVQGSRGFQLEKCSSVKGGCGYVNAGGNLPLDHPLVPGSKELELDKCSSRNKGCVDMDRGDDLIKSCTCSLCLKGGPPLSRYQGANGRKSQNAVRKLVQKYSKGEEVALKSHEKSRKSQELESELSIQWKSLFLNTGNVFQQESNQLKDSIVELKDLKENFKNDFETEREL